MWGFQYRRQIYKVWGMKEVELSKMSPNFGLYNSTGTRIRRGNRLGDKAGIPGVFKATSGKMK